MNKSCALSLDLHAHNAFAPTKYGVWEKVSTRRNQVNMHFLIAMSFYE